MFSKRTLAYFDSNFLKKKKSAEEIRKEMVREYYLYHLLLNPPDVDT